MKLDFESILSWANANRRIIIYLVLGFVLFLFLLFVIRECSNSRDLREQEKLNLEVNKLRNQQAEVNSNLANLNLQNVNQTILVNQLNQNYNVAKEEVNNARIESDKALENVNRIESSNYNGKTLDDAQQAREKAFPKR